MSKRTQKKGKRGSCGTLLIVLFILMIMGGAAGNSGSNKSNTSSERRSATATSTTSTSTRNTTPETKTAKQTEKQTSSSTGESKGSSLLYSMVNSLSTTTETQAPKQSSQSDGSTTSSSAYSSNTTFSGSQGKTATTEKRSTSVYTATTNVNVRSQPSTDSTILTTLKAYETVGVYEISNDWAEVDFNGTNAYVSSKYLQEGKIQQPETQAQASERMVWISATGSKYHSIPNCGRMNPNKAYQATESQAIGQGLGKCSKCW